MYNKHPVFESPDDNAIIWRYINFPKFFSMLESTSLHFSRVDRFSDEYEGSYPENLFDDVKPLTEKQKQSVENFKNVTKKLASSKMRVNCWNICDYESSNLWKTYVQNNGLAIQSTFKRFKESFAKTQEEVFIGKVKYIDYKKESFPDLNLFELVVHKWKFYESENELRSAIMIGTPGTKYVDFNNPPIILPIKSDLKTLIQKIVLFPGASNWIKDLIKSILKRYDHDFPVEFSMIKEK